MEASRSVRVAVLAALVGSALAASGTSAQADDGADPGVARLSVLRGAVDLKRADSGDTYAAAVNAPISAGDYVTTGDDAHAEIQYTFGASLRVARGTQLRFTRLDRDDHVAQLAQGTVELRLFRGLESHPEVATPAATVRPTENGRYRVTVTADGDSAITVRSGRADVITESGTRSVTAGTTLSVTGTGEATRLGTSPEVAYDDFDRWNGERDAYVERARDFGYVDQGIVGADDLDRYGHWEDSSYGRAWRPDVDPGWAPYNDGRWTWQPYYGWTWVAAEPWGWAPYHYGRWFYASNGWCWSPGVVARWPVVYSAPVVYATPVVYQPALVAFFSFGSGLGGFGFGNIGWVPLAPFETYRPWWGSGYANRTVNNVTNISNVTNVTNINNYYGNSGSTTVTKLYRNAGAPGGAVGVKADNFTAGRFEHVAALQPGELTKVSPIRGILPVIPTAQNLAFSNHTASAASTGLERRFAGFTPPSVATRPFVEQQAAIKRLTFKTYPHTDPAFERPIARERTSLGVPAPAKLPRAVDGAAPGRVERIDGVTIEKPATVRSSRQTGSPWGRFDRPSSELPARARTSGLAEPSHAIDASRPADDPRAEIRTRGTLHVAPVERNQSVRPPKPSDPFSRFGDGADFARRDRSFGPAPRMAAPHGSINGSAVGQPRREPLDRTERLIPREQQPAPPQRAETHVQTHVQTHGVAPPQVR